MKLDSLDVQIVQMLKKDGREQFATIARKLGVPAAVVQTRFNKMKKGGLIVGTTLLIDLTKLGIMYAVNIAIRARQSKVEEVANYVEGLKIENGYIRVHETFGVCDITLVMYLRDLRALFKVKEKVMMHPDVLHINIIWTQNVFLSYDDRLDVKKILDSVAFG